VRRALKTFIPDSPEYERLLPFVKGNIGFVFTNNDLKEIRDKILANKVAAPARAGAVANVDVWVPAGNTGMEPGKTSFFQALGVPTKIARGTIEITTDLKLVTAGGKVGASEATLLNMLNISPFTYGMGIVQVYDQGNAFPPEVLDIGEEQLLKSFGSAVSTITCLSLALNYPTLPSVFHSLINSYKNVLAVAIATEYSWPAIEELKDRIANPEAYASAAPAAGAADSGAPAAAAEETKEAEKSDEESEDEGGFGDLLYVLSLWCSLSNMRLTCLLAVKRNGSGMKLVFNGTGNVLVYRSGKGFSDLCIQRNRSFAGRTCPHSTPLDPCVTISTSIMKLLLSEIKRSVKVEFVLFSCPLSPVL
jgi:large subunit ribosomal protein LP0